MITSKSFKEYSNCKNKLITLKNEFFEKAKEVFLWENENIGTFHDVTQDGSWVCKDIVIEKDTIWFYVYETWSYGGYEEKEIYIETYKLVDDSWREIAIQQYQEQLEEERVAKELEAKARAIELEMKERAELRRLQEKYRGK